jgi:hypothetical protein
MTLNNEKIVALKSELENLKDHINSKCCGSIKLNLTISVLTDPHSITCKFAKRKNGDLVLMANFYKEHIQQ